MGTVYDREATNGGLKGTAGENRGSSGRIRQETMKKEGCKKGSGKTSSQRHTAYEKGHKKLFHPWV